MAESGYGFVRTNIHAQYDHVWGHVSDGFGARVSYRFLHNRKFSLSANFKYNTVSSHFFSSDLSLPFEPEAIGLNGIHMLGQLGLTATMRAKLFGRQFIGMCIVASEWSVGGFNRLSAVAMGLAMLWSSRNTQFGVGPLMMVNTTSKMPVFLVFMYRHRFNGKWTVNLYGGMFGIEFAPLQNNLFVIGADIDAKSFYFKPGAEGLPKTCRYTQTNFRPMIKYRYKLGANFYFDVQGGVSLGMSGRVTGVNGTKEYIKINQKCSPFLQASVSYSL